MTERVADTIAKYGMLRAGEHVGVAVSGGPDSVALLRVLCELRADLGLAGLAVVHLDHGLRGDESKADAQFVRELAESLGLEFVLETADLRAEAAGSGENLEQAARRRRYEFFRRLIGEGRFQKIAVGHTKSDQAETVLFRFLRGAAAAGLAGIYPVVDGVIVRPLIEVERADVLDYLLAAGQAWREDSTNQDQALARNRLRQQLLPQLERDWNPAIVNAMAHLADWARDEELYWSVEIRRLAGELLRREERMIYFEAPRIAALPPAVGRRLLRYAVEQVRGNLRGIEFAHIERIRAIVAAPEGDGRARVPGVDVFRSFNQVRLAPVETLKGLDGRNYSLTLVIPGTYDLPQIRRSFSFKLCAEPEADQGYNSTVVGRLDWERTPRRLWLRNWRPGDRYHPIGWSGEEKLKTLFQQRKVPLWERGRWPVVASETEVLWARQFGPAAGLAAGPGSKTVLEISEQEKTIEGPAGSV